MKKAFVFDTNFIIENLNLKEVVATLNEEFTVYVTQVSIEERISQKYMELKKKYDNLINCTKECNRFAHIKITIPLEENLKKYRVKMERSYTDLFGEHIIPFSQDSTTFSKILDRVYKKLPPFLAADGASDKGFKDSLIWLSLLDFFQTSGENEVFFVTNDSGFKKSADILCKEFTEYTGKNIVFKDNSYYRSRFEVKISEVVSNPPLPDVNQLREKVSDVIYSLCGIDSIDFWGNPDWDRTFTLNERVDDSYMEIIFDHLKQDIRDHIFEVSVPADKILDLDGRVTNGVSIPTTALENALSLYEEIQKKLPEYLPQFYNATTLIINRNYIETQVIQEDDDQLPF